jgi:hypothetical protein
MMWANPTIAGSCTTALIIPYPIAFSVVRGGGGVHASLHLALMRCAVDGGVGGLPLRSGSDSLLCTDLCEHAWVLFHEVQCVSVHGCCFTWHSVQVRMVVLSHGTV